MSRTKAALLLLALAVYLAGTLANAATHASFTDVATGGATFTTGSVNIALSADADCDAGSYSDTVGAVLSATGRVLGDVSTASICIKNTGSLTTRWSLLGDISDDAAGALESAMKVRFWWLTNAGATAGTACLPGFSADGTDASLAGQGGFRAEIAPTTAASTNPSFGPSADTEILASEYAKLCFSVVLPSGASSTLTSKALTMNFTITGNQQ